jgi:DNA-directed RNA polymerase sigma subunit (sigma70/sigma32)
MMTWAEVGLALGVSEQAAFQVGQKALRKLRKRPGALEKLKSLATAVETERQKRNEGTRK